MRKLLIAVVLFAMVVWAAQPLLLLEPDGSYGRTSKTYKNMLPTRDFKTALKGSKDISTANWMLQYHNNEWTYYMPRPTTDTQATRFSPPTECSLVAFEVIHYNTTTGQVGQPYYLFVADQRNDIDYDTFPSGDAVPSYFVSPLGPKFPGYENITSFALPNGEWDQIQCEIYIPYDEITGKSNDFFCGYRPGTNNFAILSTGFIPFDTPRNSHSYRFRTAWGRWYGYYWLSDYTKLEFGITAYIRALRNLPPKLDQDRLPNTYDTEPRLILAWGEDFGVPVEMTGIEQAWIEYDINGTPGTPIYLTLFWGDSTAGGYYAYLPGANVGDIVTYRMIAFDYQGLACTTSYWSYEIKAGTPGNGLYVKGNAAAIYDDYIESNYNVDVWDIAVENGAPDEAVFNFYMPPEKTPGSWVVIWKGWGETNLSFNNYGSGFARVGDTLYLAALIDGGGFFWLEDQDGLYGLDFGIWYDYGQHDATPGSFVHRYFGILQGTDDGTWAGLPDYDIYGDPADPVIGTLFSGTIGQQTTEGIIRHGGMCGLDDGSREWAGSIDAYETYALPEMTAEDGTVLAVRQELTKAGKAIFHIFGSSWIVDPANPSSYDEVAIHTLQDLYISWSNLGVKEPKPDVKIVEISNPRLNGSEVLMNVKLPYRANLKVLVHDISGRVLGKAFEGEASGLRTISYNTARTNPGTYFLSVYVNGELKGAKKFILVK